MSGRSTGSGKKIKISRSHTRRKNKSIHETSKEKERSLSHSLPEEAEEHRRPSNLSLPHFACHKRQGSDTSFDTGSVFSDTDSIHVVGSNPNSPSLPSKAGDPEFNFAKVGKVLY